MFDCLLIIKMEELRKKCPYFFLIIISAIIIFIYFCVVKLLVLDIHPWGAGSTGFFLVLYHLIFVLLLWSIIQTIRTDPGRVPIQWVSHHLLRASAYKILPESTVSYVTSINLNGPTIARLAVAVCSIWTITGIYRLI